MSAAVYRMDVTRVLAQIALLGCCALIAVAVRAVIVVDTLGDPAELALNAAALVVLLMSAVSSFFVVRATRALASRTAVALVSLSIFGLAGGFARHAYTDVSVELADLISPAQAAEETSQIVVGPNEADVRLSGDINEGAASLLEEILAAHPSITRIHLTSDGGFADEGEALGRVIAAHHLTTYVPDYCLSACTLAFVGGRERILMDGARLGFHAPYQQGVLGQTFAGDASEQRAAYLGAGLAADFVEEALRVSPDDLWTPEPARLLAAHVATAFVDRYRFPDSILDGSADSHGARDAVLRNFSVLKSIEAVSPRTVDRIAAWYLRAYRRGASEGAATDGLEAIVGATVTVALARADDATLLDLGRFVQSALSVEPPPRDCTTIGEGVDLVRATVALEDSDKDADTQAEHLVGRALASRRPGAPAAFARPVAFAAPARETCASLRQAYGDALHRRDLAALRRRLQVEAPKAIHLLAPLAGL